MVTVGRTLYHRRVTIVVGRMPFHQKAVAAMGRILCGQRIVAAVVLRSLLPFGLEGSMEDYHWRIEIRLTAME